MKKPIASLIVAIAAVVSFTACDKQETNDGMGGALTVKMTDAPGDYAALNVEIAKVDVYSESSGWVTISNESRIVNVLELTNGAETTLAHSSSLEAGVYTKAKVFFGTANSVQIQSGGQFHSLDMGAEGSVIIDINAEVQAEAEAQAAAEVLLDFNVAQSVAEVNGVFTLHPTVTEIDDPETGVSGQVHGVAIAAVILSSGNLSYSGYTDASGNFLIRGLAAGTYSLTIQGQSDLSAGLEGAIGGGIGLIGVAQGGANAGVGALLTATYPNVVIVEGQIVSMGSITLQ
ncbi:MAG: DUF4382 domain-containing protein [Flavobacteriales bacterium]|nr:DUF4382 domain-containing protein [Flavobacteriales bacterium]